MALRGWRREDFDTVTSEFRDAVRHALFSERAVTLLEEATEIAQMSEQGVIASDLAKVGRARIDAAARADQIRALMKPED